ncbi:hypothetical protein CDD80_5448 [Ophiocordyceps camponoti-rufipedis]|uniref:DUF676 domain-containing protein n=1 Tax=Ophiocordyceps camponoti-rufipedis TaxID=2004952 RepID=A0A2C5ZID1_9HYPO|nr:hypothetical protein CDD80_5448 [Ophiocordyceps camponoti-rufipedis]
MSPPSSPSRLQIESPPPSTLLLHQTGNLRVGELVRYSLSYTPESSVRPEPSRLHVRIANSCPVARRLAVFPGPFTLSVCAYPAVFDPFRKLGPEHGAPRFESQVKAGTHWDHELLIPPPEHRGQGLDGDKTVSWIIEVSSQVVFTKSAAVGYELLVGTDIEVLAHTTTDPGRLADHQKLMRAHGEPSEMQSPGVFSSVVRVKVEDTVMLWTTPPIVPPSSIVTTPQKRRKIHLVILTHGLNSAIGADLIFLKESIDAAAKEAKAQALAAGSVDEDEYEDVIVRGYSGNAVKTQRGIKYLGKRVAKYVLSMTYPDQPHLPTGSTPHHGFAQGFAGDLDSRHQRPHPYAPQDYLARDRQSYQITSISFVGHSLGGPTQTYAIAYIQKHSPDFFNLIKPRSFVTLASPMLGVGSENPLYVRLCLEAGFVGQSGRDLGLTWGPKTIARGGWGALISSFAGSESGDRPGSRPLMRDLPRATHAALCKFTSRTVYANIVNDGIVPLRTSSLFFVDWQGIERVEGASREQGIIGAVSRHFRTQSHEKQETDRDKLPPLAPTPARAQTMPRSDRPVSRKNKQMLSRGQTFHLDELPSAGGTDPLADIQAPPTTTVLEGFGDVLTPVIASRDFIVDPESRPKTIIHDRLYRPADIPPLPDDDMRVEERVARSYHRDMTWRKVLVRLEPDAHNNIIVRRQFSNAHGWPVIKHLVDHHFGCSQNKPVDSAKPLMPIRTRSEPVLRPVSDVLARTDSEDEGEILEDGGKLQRLAAGATAHAAPEVRA